MTQHYLDAEISTNGGGDNRLKMSSITCRLCNQPIKFDDKHISQRTGKKIPLAVATNEPHDCPVRRDQPQQQQQLGQQSKTAGLGIPGQQLCLHGGKIAIILRDWHSLTIL
jgi:hypothetical protein